jgi:hypothetical protein
MPDATFVHLTLLPLQPRRLPAMSLKTPGANLFAIILLLTTIAAGTAPVLDAA